MKKIKFRRIWEKDNFRDEPIKTKHSGVFNVEYDGDILSFDVFIGIDNKIYFFFPEEVRKRMIN